MSTENCTIKPIGERQGLQKIKEAAGESRGSVTAAAAGTAAGLQKTDVQTSVFLRFLKRFTGRIPGDLRRVFLRRSAI